MALGDAHPYLALFCLYIDMTRPPISIGGRGACQTRFLMASTITLSRSIP